MIYDLIIIGGGASGLCTAIKAKLNKKSVLIIEHTDRVGKKILSTGNGKCNLTNSYCKVGLFENNPENIYPFFTSGSKEFVEKVINAYDCEKTVDFFEGLGILLENKNGYIYPRSEQASTINDFFRLYTEKLKIDLLTHTEINDIEYKSNGDFRFSVNKKYKSRNLLLATGGCAAAKTGSDGSGYDIAADFGHRIIKPVPALCGVKCSEKFVKELAGVRNDCKVKLYDDDILLYETKGNVQFTNYGLSGIPLFQISSEIGKLLNAGRHLVICVDLLPELTAEQIINFISRSASNIKYDSLSDLLCGLLNKKLASVLIRQLSDASVKDMAYKIKNFVFTPKAINSFDEAQTCAGGVDTSQIDPDTCMSKLIPGLFFAGEIIDVNGICGGYNLQWAWSTADISAHNLL